MNKKYAIVFSLALLSLMAVGVSYAHWWKVIYVDGYVDTGYFHVYPGLTLDPLPLKEDRWVVAEWGDIIEEVDQEGAEWIKFSLNNAYPCLTASMRLTITNDGSIPAGLKNFGLVSLTPAYANDYDPVISEDYTLPDGSVCDYYIEVYDYTHPYFPDIPVAEVCVKLGASDCTLWPTNSWMQVDPGCSAWADITVHFNEALPQDEVFDFVFRLEYWNWNEVEYPI